MTTSVKANWVADLPRKALVAVILVAVALGGLIAGGYALWLLLSAFALLMMVEWATLAAAEGRDRWVAIVGLAAALVAVSPALEHPGWLSIAIILGAAVVIGLLSRNAQLGGGAPYIALPVLSLLFVRDEPGGLMLAAWTLALVWATDIGAYFAGRLIGGPKIAPSVSPNKTWAGLAGGMVAALVTGLLFHVLGGLTIGLALASAPLAAVAQAGDFFESALKRNAGVKDSGTILPGHGGVLDRLDGLVPVSVVVALILAAGVRI
ncbi:phosphatidate cytidylyltransferase [Sphingomonas sanxanigenens]|uniref:Phosphatidate cytidylyltransferase n=1 Tax=Sphingomonas sanxanigenens DSM 19645 = NX02 TaxID=1123269 RepID=W0ABV6_9SPHN|nr:phosphatidate cytidylyltransferase [Sphingomonas sanxanigenens]AHE54556.1 hypothetical protein NX02_14350 [Sphingomonas sanxanigenens DSM 19645 = NX02]